ARASLSLAALAARARAARRRLSPWPRARRGSPPLQGLRPRKRMSLSLSPSWGLCKSPRRKERRICLGFPDTRCLRILSTGCLRILSSCCLGIADISGGSGRVALEPHPVAVRLIAPAPDRFQVAERDRLP